MKNLLTHWRKSLPIAVKTRPTSFSAMPISFGKLIENFYQEAFNPDISFDNRERLMISPYIDILEDSKQFKIEIEIEMPGIGMGPEDFNETQKNN